MSGHVWPAHARQWSLLGPPLRPSREDVAIVERVARESKTCRPLLLGVTPEIAACEWPEEATLTAVDSSEEMIAAVWPAAAVRSGRVICADWRAMPIDDASVDLVAGDGVLAPLEPVLGASALFRELGRVTRRGAHVVLRAFVLPASPEEPRAVVSDLRGGRIGSFHAFKWRLVMAVHRPSARGVKLADAWSAWRELVPDPRETLATLGWAHDLVATIDPYRDSRAVYVFPSVDEIALAARDHFELVEVLVPRYELGERCPTLVFRRRA